MALAVSNLTSGTTNASQTSYTTASITPTSGDLIIVTVENTSSAPLPSKLGPPTITGAGLTFYLISPPIIPGVATRGINVFYAVADGSATAGALTITFAVAPANNIGWIVDKVTGQDSTSRISWLVQAVTNFSATAVGGPYTVTLGTLQDTSSVAYGVHFSVITAANSGPGTGFTQLAEVALSGSLLSSEYKVNDPNISWTITTGTSIYAAMGLEITASNSGARNNPLANHFLGCSGAGA